MEQNVCVDSRLLQKGDIFFALGGERVDGHQFLEQVAEKGASSAVVKKDYTGPDFGLSLERVDDPLSVLQQWACSKVKKNKAQIVGITGSLGKTTTKEFLYTLLQERFSVACTPGNMNSQIGLPLTILNHVKGNEEILILEMGMTHPGQLSKLVQIAPPDIALITTIGLVHACNFDSIEAIATAKAEILSHPETRLGIIPRASEQYSLLHALGNCTKRSFGINTSDADVYMLGDCIYQSDGIEIPLETFPFPGIHNKHNFLAAATCARALGLTWAEIKQTIPKLKLYERRLEHIEKNGILFVNDSYNAAMLSMQAALQSLPQPKKGGKKIAVLGEMPELGSFSEHCHRQVGEYALDCVDRILCLGKECAPIVSLWQQKKRPIDWFEERSQIVAALKVIASPGDVVLLKGSNKKQLWKVLEEI